MRFTGKNILVVGATGNIGRAISRELAKEEATLILVGRNHNNLLSLQKELNTKTYCVTFDFESEMDVESVMDLLTQLQIKLDGMIFTSGICEVKQMKDVSFDEMNQAMRINVFSFSMLAKLFYKPKFSNREAGIVAISSYESVLNEKGMGLYAMTKNALDSQVKVISKELIRRKTRVNAVLPARIMSKMGNDGNQWNDSELEEIERIQSLGAIPIEQVVKSSLFLLSDDAKYVTGECMAISGGYGY